MHRAGSILQFPTPPATTSTTCPLSHTDGAVNVAVRELRTRLTRQEWQWQGLLRRANPARNLKAAERGENRSAREMAVMGSPAQLLASCGLPS